MKRGKKTFVKERKHVLISIKDEMQPGARGGGKFSMKDSNKEKKFKARPPNLFGKTQQYNHPLINQQSSTFKAQRDHLLIES